MYNLDEEVIYNVEWIRGLVNKKEKDLDAKLLGGDFCEVFKADNKWGKLGNMASKGMNPLFVTLADGRRVEFTCSESLYMSLRFNKDVDAINEFRTLTGRGCKAVRNQLLGQGKIVSREDFDDVVFELMRWVLRVKLMFNENTFGKLLKESEGRTIVEVCNRFDERSKLWGCGEFEGRNNRGRIKGRNVLGKLLMELRDEYKSNGWTITNIAPPNIDDLSFFGSSLVEIVGK